MPIRLGPCHMPSPTRRVFLHLHDHLTATEERVADELARAQSNLGISHVGAVPIWARSAVRL